MQDTQETQSNYFKKYKNDYHTIYLIENSTGYYIGNTTTDINYRLHKHKTETRYNKERYNWLRESIGTDPVTITELHRTTCFDNAKLLEKSEILRYYTLYKNIKKIFNKNYLPTQIVS